MKSPRPLCPICSRRLLRKAYGPSGAIPRFCSPACFDASENRFSTPILASAKARDASGKTFARMHVVDDGPDAVPEEGSDGPGETPGRRWRIVVAEFGEIHCLRFWTEKDVWAAFDGLRASFILAGFTCETQFGPLVG